VLVNDPDSIALMIIAFGDRDVARLVDRVEECIEDIRCVSPGLGTLAYLGPRWSALLDAPLPIPVDLRALRRCMRLACADGENAAGFQHWTS
jgi:hypothetical protein